jgi:hypothetical protein
MSKKIDNKICNLASHLKTLEENEYIKVEKGFVGRKAIPSM